METEHAIPGIPPRGNSAVPRAAVDRLTVLGVVLAMVAGVALAVVALPRVLRPDADTQDRGEVLQQDGVAPSDPAQPTVSAIGTDPEDTFPGSTGPVGRWSQVFGDEFDSGQLDRSRWRANRYGYDGTDDGAFNPSYEDAYYSVDNVTVQDGEAVLGIRPEPAVIEGASYTHSSGMLTTHDSFLLQDGDYVEARVWVPSGAGLWPAFWTSPLDRWPPEIDIFEFFDSAKPQLPTFVYHEPDPTEQDNGLHLATYGRSDVDYRDSWHVYGMHRHDGRIVVYLDGVACPQAGVDHGADDLPQFLVINLAMYDHGSPGAGAGMRVDWVRAWRPAI